MGIKLSAEIVRAIDRFVGKPFAHWYEPAPMIDNENGLVQKALKVINDDPHDGRVILARENGKNDVLYSCRHFVRGFPVDEFRPVDYILNAKGKLYLDFFLKNSQKRVRTKIDTIDPHMARALLVYMGEDIKLTPIEVSLLEAFKLLVKAETNWSTGPEAEQSSEKWIHPLQDRIELGSSYDFKIRHIPANQLQGTIQQGRFQKATLEHLRGGCESSFDQSTIPFHGSPTGTALVSIFPHLNVPPLKEFPERFVMEVRNANDCPIGYFSRNNSAWQSPSFKLDRNVRTQTILSGDYDQDGKTDILVQLTNGAAYLLKTVEGPSVSSICDPPAPRPHGSTQRPRKSAR
jgi:hypothetical protein